MDTLVRIEYHEETTVVNSAQKAGSYQKSKQRVYSIDENLSFDLSQASLEMALSDLSTLTRMRQSILCKTLCGDM
jgi:hypothetical protein